VLRPRLAHEGGAREVVTSLCPECDEGGRFEELFYTDERGRLLPYVMWMEHRGLDPATGTASEVSRETRREADLSPRTEDNTGNIIPIPTTVKGETL
jgi:hypothetical protein